jgi:hypothetical protein
MECSVHPGTPAQHRCAGCAEGYCINCLVNVTGEYYCNACKSMATEGVTPAIPINRICDEAKHSLMIALSGTVLLIMPCAVWIHVIIAVFSFKKGTDARKRMCANPALGGEGMVIGAFCIIGINMIFTVLGFVLTVAIAAA